MEKDHGQAPPQAVTLSYQPAAPQTVNYGPHGQSLVCPHCHHQITTSVKAENSTKTHIIALLCCGFCCCCIPYCMDSCKDKNHYCPSCSAYLGSYKR